MKTIPQGSEPQSEYEVIREKIKNPDGNYSVRLYRKEELLGSGGFAKCYRVIDIQTGV